MDSEKTFIIIKYSQYNETNQIVILCNNITVTCILSCTIILWTPCLLSGSERTLLFIVFDYKVLFKMFVSV